MSFFRQDQQFSPCSVSQEFVDYVAQLSPELLLDKEGQPIIPRVLFMLGFHINIDKPYNDIYIIPNSRVRTATRPYETYITTVYNGRTRNVLGSYENWVCEYVKCENHPLKRLYEEVEVVTIGHVDEALITDINDIGNILAYNLGMSNMNKRFDPNKSDRNIVR